MSISTRKKWLRLKRRIAARLRPRKFEARATPMFAAANIHYDMADRARALVCGGIGSIHLLARKIGLIDALDRDVHLLKIHLPYHESYYVLNIAYNLLCSGTCLEDIELHRNDETYLDALGAKRIPDPTTAGDFCQRFKSADDVNQLQESINLRANLDGRRQRDPRGNCHSGRDGFLRSPSPKLKDVPFHQSTA